MSTTRPAAGTPVPGHPFPRQLPTVVTYASRALLEQLLSLSIIFLEDWEHLPAGVREELEALDDKTELLPRLLELKLLTPFQAGHIQAGRASALVLGNYRLLEPLGDGGMGSVYRVVHTRLRRQVAAKLLPFTPEQDGRLLRRFYSEMQAVAQLQHPNIVGVLDAGEVASPDRPDATIHYYVMDIVDPGNWTIG